MYGVIQLQGHQYIVQKWDKIVVDKLPQKEWSKLDIKEVLAVFEEDGKVVKVGRPFVEGASVQTKVVAHQKWDKINVVKFKNKTRYQRKYGFRPHQSVVEIVAVKDGVSTTTKSAKEAQKTADKPVSKTKSTAKKTTSTTKTKTTKATTKTTTTTKTRAKESKK